MNKKFIGTIAMLLAVVLLAQPFQSNAQTELEKIEAQIKQLEKQMNAAAHSKKQAENERKRAEQEIQTANAMKQATKADINNLLAQIEQVSAALQETSEWISSTESQLQQIGRKLEETIQKKNGQDELFRDRARMLYMDGAVSYLDVILSSTSFTDFLERFDAVESIMAYDKEILNQIQKYEAEIQEQQAQKDADLAKLKELYAQRAERIADLEAKEKEKEVMIANFNRQIEENEHAIEESEEISEEAERTLMELAKKVSELEAKKASYKTYYDGGKLATPLKYQYRLSSSFGTRKHPITGKVKQHTGIDMAAPNGTPVYAAESGVVTVAQSWSGYGNTIIIDHGGGIWTLYGHLKPGGILVKKGETVKRGQKIGLVGMTGTATGYHLHFEVRKNGEPVDPAPYLK